jgi:hypothetical protein
MAEARPSRHILNSDPDRTPKRTRPRHSRSRKKLGQGGTRRGFVSDNEIEDMSIFDKDPGKAPSKDAIHDGKAIDANRFQRRK